MSKLLAVLSWFGVVLFGFATVGTLIARIDGSYKGSTLTWLIQEGIEGTLFALSLWCVFILWRRNKKKTEETEEFLQTVIAQIESGKLPEATPQSLIMHTEEKAYAVTPAQLLENKTLGYSGGGASMRFRVAKGVSVSVGGGRGHADRAIVPVANGELVVTNQRIAFAGDLKSFDIPFRKLTNIEPYTDGFAFNEGSRSHIVKVTGSMCVTITKNGTQKAESLSIQDTTTIVHGVLNHLLRQ
jgi:hypothetical protein